MKILTLMRHAKSAWDDPALSDRERGLTPRGSAAAALAGRMMADRDWLPDLVLCSDAVRARQTATIVMEEWPVAVPIRYDGALYLSGAAGVAEVIRQQGGDAESLLVVGHNPDSERLVLMLDPVDTPARRRLEAKFPTAGVARLVLSIDSWPELDPGRTRARLTDFVTPREAEAERRR